MKIITQQDIINTYSKRQQEQSRLYYEYKRIKRENPEFGYKRISKLLDQPEHKTRWWNARKHTPVPIQTINWLKEKELIPLNEDDKRLPLISRILGTTFGDGGIDINHNMIFLSSSELKSLEDFKQDFIEIFGKEIEKNFDIRRGGINETSYCIRNTNRNAIRFFKALGSPIGNKTKQVLRFPEWMGVNQTVEDEFFFSLFGSEVGIPKCRGGQANTFDIAIGGLPELHENRYNLMNQIKDYLLTKGIESGKISINKSKSGKNQHTFIYRLLISTKVENMMNFLKKVRLNYCYYKTDKLKNTIDEILIIKHKRFRDIEKMYGWNKKIILKVLNVKGKEIPFRE
ncbi:hypothetical protein HYV89_02580 [Candidatus Woesearchaeota archaeon]|nr:hypothetical protein [Candidatus Woesearchaeota archaeon]